MSPPGAFLGGARGRLLPASIPLRCFGAAAAFHLLAWLALAAGAAHWPRYAGGPGWLLAALHLLTLGVLAMTALGAGAQLLPVATRQAAPTGTLLAAVWWLYTPGVAVLALGMGLSVPAWMAVGALAVVPALAVWLGLMVRHLVHARGMPGVVAHGWAALAALVVVLFSAAALVGLWLGWPGWGRELPLTLHRLAGPFGFMGLLALGLSYILVPMFALADAPAERLQLWSGLLVAAALALAAAAAPGRFSGGLHALAVSVGGVGVALHLVAMRRTLRSGMRRELGPSFTLVRIGWAGLLASVALAGALWAHLPLPGLEAAFGLAVVGVWLLSFMLGMLQRIAPFLAAMHGGSGRRAPTPSALTHDAALRVHLACHVGALALLGLAIVADSAGLARAGALLGAGGAAAFGVFFAVLLRRVRSRTP